VPYYVKTFAYPANYVVQDVTLESRSDPETTSGLHLEAVHVDPNEPPPEMIPGWYPEDVFSWSFLRDADGTGSLVVMVYPFCYEPETTQVRFFRRYQFRVAHAATTITLVELQPEQPAYQQGETVRADIVLSNSGAAQDLTLQIAFRLLGALEPAGGPPLRQLQKMAGDASVSAEWDSTGAQAGPYLIEVRVMDATGGLLEFGQAGFELTSGRAEFRIGQAYYTIGGVRYEMDVAPYIKSDRTFLPVRFVAYACGVPVEGVTWDGATRTVGLLKGSTYLSLQIGSKALRVTRGSTTTTVTMDVAPEITSDRTMLPVRWVAEQFGYTVGWVADTRTVTLDP